MTEALRACPWCDTVPNMTDNLATDSGSKAEIGKWAWIECDCGARSPDVRANWGRLPDWQQDAADAWNRRAPVALPTREEVAEALFTWRCADHSECKSEWMGKANRPPITDCDCRMSEAGAILNLMRERMG